MDFSKLKDVLVGAAPTLATALGGPAAGLVVSMLSKAFGLSSADPDQLAKQIALDPESSLKLAQLEADHAKAMREMDMNFYKLQLEDIASARLRETEVVKVRGKSDLIMQVLSGLITVGFFLTMTLFMSDVVNISQTEQNVFSLLIGMLVSKFGTVIDYYFGSSREIGK